MPRWRARSCIMNQGAAILMPRALASLERATAQPSLMDSTTGRAPLSKSLQGQLLESSRLEVSFILHFKYFFNKDASSRGFFLRPFLSDRYALYLQQLFDIRLTFGQPIPWLDLFRFFP